MKPSPAASRSIWIVPADDSSSSGAGCQSSGKLAGKTTRLAEVQLLRKFVASRLKSPKSTRPERWVLQAVPQTVVISECQKRHELMTQADDEWELERHATPARSVVGEIVAGEVGHIDITAD